MKTISACITVIVLFCATSVYCVENRDVQGTFYRNARVIKANKDKLSSVVDELVAKTRVHDLPEPLYKFTENECSKYFLDPIGKKFAVFSDSKYKGTYAINGYSASFSAEKWLGINAVNWDNIPFMRGDGGYIYEIISDYKPEHNIMGTLNLFNIDFKAIPQQAKVRKIDNTDIFNIYISSSETDGRGNKIEKVYGIDIDKNGHEDFVILSKGWDNASDYVKEEPELSILMNNSSKPMILKLGTISFPFVEGCNVISDISFVDYDATQPVLISLVEAGAESGRVGQVLYCYEKGTCYPLYSDFSYSD